MRDIDDVTGVIIDTGYRLHKRLGPGLLESAYTKILARSLEQQGLTVEREKNVAFEFEGIRIEDGFRLDLLVEGRVVVELKSVEAIAPVHTKQVLTYLRLLNLQVGLLMNFGAPTFKEGLRRIVNSHVPTSASPLRRNNIDARS
jgi:GxxExxY protein